MSLYRELYTQLQNRNFYVAVFITLICSLAGKALSLLPGLSLIGHLVLALLLGMLVQLSAGITRTAREGTGYISNRFLRLGIILLGFKLNLYLLFTSGLPEFLVACITVPCMIALTYFICRRVHVDPAVSILTI